MGTDEHFLPLQRFQHIVVYHLQSQVLQTFHLGTVVDNITQAVEATVILQHLLCRSNGLHHSEAIARMFVNQYLHSINH